MKIITMNGSVILGNIEVKDGVTTITDGLSLGAVATVTKQHLANYLKAQNLGTLDKPVEVTGNGAMFSKRELSDDQALELQILELKFALAEKNAPAKLVNDEFDNLI